ncbi:MAG: multicopper oxidase domain-containing protein [Cypionkella sp.]
MIPAQRFRVDLTNALDEETIIHWHGQIPPNVQDGVPEPADAAAAAGRDAQLRLSRRCPAPTGCTAMCRCRK